MTCVRHANTGTAVGPDDKNRRLTALGRTQAEARQEKLGNPNFDLILVSPLVRTHETAAILAGTDLPGLYSRRLMVVPELHIEYLREAPDTEAHPSLQEMFRRLGQAPLRAYLEQNEEETELLIDCFGCGGWEELTRLLWGREFENTLVVGHAVLLPAIIHTGALESITKQLLDFPFEECQGVQLELDNSESVTKLTLLD